MITFKFPVCSGKQNTLPRDTSAMLCPWCKKQVVGEPNSFASLQGGCYTELGDAILLIDDSDNRKTIGDTFLTLWWHGAHDNGSGLYPGADVTLRIVDDVPKRNFRLYFCSPKCLRSFLNHALDRFEEMIEEDFKKWGNT